MISVPVDTSYHSEPLNVFVQKMLPELLNDEAISVAINLVHHMQMLRIVTHCKSHRNPSISVNYICTSVTNAITITFSGKC